MNVYKHQTITNLEAFYGDLLFNIEKHSTIQAHLTALAKRMWEGVQSKEMIVFKEINNYHPNYLGQFVESLQTLNLSEIDCKTTVAHQYGFMGWEMIEKLDDLKYNIPFENAVNALLDGELEIFKKLIDRKPSLINTTSQYGHEATLLHYVASNGVEMWRQKVPFNLKEMTTFLIERGANKAATMKVYGNYFTTHQLFSSSAHPFEAGIAADVLPLL